MIRRVKHIYCPRTSVLTWHLDPLHNLFSMLPKTEQIFRDNIHIANLERGIKSPEFQDKKERILILYYLLENVSGLNRTQTQTLADAVLIPRDKQVILGLLKVAKKEDKGSPSGGFFAASQGFVKRTPCISNMSEDALWRDANNFASSIPDSRFLSKLETTPVDECLRDAIVKAEEAAHTYLKKQIKSLVDGLAEQIFTIQKEECDKQIEQEITSQKAKELGIIRSGFVHQVEALSRERSRSYVHYSLGKWPMA